MALTDRYEIVRALGHGAFGEVYLARDRLHGGREVALKTIRARVDDLLRAAFEREFATMAAVSVPGVAQVHDFGVMREHAGNPAAPFFTRAFIDGQPLDLAAAKLALPERVRLFMKVAAALAPLHRAGVVHGDIKPGNAIIDGQGEAWLIDFGLSRMQGQDRRRESLAAAGTPPFMAPELLRGESATVSADIYALGVTLWLLVTSEHPFSSFGHQAISARLEGKLPEIPLTADAGTRGALQVALRALARDPLDRFPSVDELLMALGAFSGVASDKDEAATRVARAFIPPRPRGHDPLLATLETLVADRAQKEASGKSAVWLVHAPTGGGKSLLLRELKWRLQLRSHLVLEVFAGRSGASAPLLSLIEQLLLARGSEGVLGASAQALLSDIRGGKLEERAVTDTLAALLSEVARETSVVLCIDDLDGADAVLGAVLRSAVHSEMTRGVALIATATRINAPAVRELHADRQFAVPALSAQDIAALACDALGPLDSSALDALVEHVAGLPGALISALVDLSTQRGVTAADVRKLAPGEAALALTRARLSRAPLACLPVLEALALTSAWPLQLTEAGAAALGLAASQIDALLIQLEALGLVASDAGFLTLADSGLRKAIREGLGEPRARLMAAKLLDSALGAGLPLPERARLSVIAGDQVQLRKLAPEAARMLTQVGAHAAAAELLAELLACADGGLRRDTLLSLARCQHALGEDEATARLAGELAADSEAEQAIRADATILLARALTGLGRLDDAVSALALLPQDTDAARHARVQSELAKVHLRRGDYAAMAAAADAGLASAPPTDRVRVELLCGKGMVASYLGNHEAARKCHEEALAGARAYGEKRDEASALTYLAIGCQRCGEMTEARDLQAQSLEIARELGDVGNMATFSLNLGAVLFHLGEHAPAAEHYESAARLARRAGRLSTEVQARNNLALSHVYFGLYERARVEITEVRADAERAGHKFIGAQATALLADLLSRTGQVDKALIQYDDAITRYEKLGQIREIAEHNLDAAEALLDRGGPADTSAAAARLATARTQIEREKLEDLRLRMELLVARARITNGDADAAVQSLHDVVERARKRRDRDVEWQALAALSAGHEVLGGSFAARRDARLAVEVLEEIALRIPREHREAFWHDPRRRVVRERASEDASQSVAHAKSDPHPSQLEPGAERTHLLEIIKRLASEHDLDRLLERITESAVDLSGAERGSVLLVNPGGQLAPHVTRTRGPVQDEAHVAFSRSIAEAVLIDGEPIVTVDATVDGRLQEYVSVHKLMLRSVACLPIAGHSGTVGVLYLEHRRSRGRFSEAAVDLLCAFADQAAIAIENARLLAEIRKQKQELEQANGALAKAKDDLEDMLLARTRQLDDVQRELSRATHPHSDGTRHGMVGRSQPMQRVFDAIDRLAGATVSVVIRGESGTGKELVARAIHYAGPRAKAPFVAINCGALPEALLESELFGHVKGAFSGADRDKRGMIAAASGGTLFLDEVCDMPPKMQVDLLRVLQESKVCRIGSDVDEAVDVRVVTASQRPLAELVAEGKFREDLFYRLSVVDVALPALRERRDDIPILCEHFLRLFAERDGMPKRHLTRAALAHLMEQPWPGNVRQLEHGLLQAAIMAEGSTIDAKDLAPARTETRSRPPSGASVAPEAAVVAGIANLDHHKLDEKQRILEALQACGWNRVRAAQQLGMPRRTFYRRLSDYSIL